MYISKDYIHHGSGLLLDKEKAWPLIAHSARKNVNKVRKNNTITVKQVAGDEADIATLRSMWYDPEDPNIPPVLFKEDGYMFIAYDNEHNSAIGCVILLKTGNHLFLNNLAGNAEGKKLGVQDFLLWFCVEFFSDSDYKYIDVGVSYRRTLYKFFDKWKTIKYPVIFNKPEVSIPITKTPFESGAYLPFGNKKGAESGAALLDEMFPQKWTFVPGKNWAVSILKELGHEANDWTFNWHLAKANPAETGFIDLTRVFPMQFGSLLIGTTVSDEDMWNRFHCFDYYKRELVLTQLNSNLPQLQKSITERKQILDCYNESFALEDIEIIPNEDEIPSRFVFTFNENSKYHSKLKAFDVEHDYDESTNTISLPVHQNLTNELVTYLYGIFRGVLNLCSEWQFTEKYSSYKNV